MASPLGRYSEAAALITALVLVFAWLLVQLGIVHTTDYPGALNSAAALAIGIILGQRSTTNGAAKVAMAAHRRLDALGAAPAPEA